jgi:CIC family chloride channel protein
MADKMRSWSYLRKWVAFSLLIGMVSGVGAEVFQLIFKFFTDLFLVSILNYTPPLPGGEGAMGLPDLSSIRWWLLPAVVGLGGLLSGIIVYSIAPEAEGHGTDSVIESFHRMGGRIRKRVPIVKMVASSITIGSGGSAGREGPIAQIGAGFGSWLATTLKLGDHDRRIMVVCGVAAGIGAIFKAPLGASLFAIEVLYKRDMEVETLVPAFVSSVISYSIFASINGFTPIFSPVDYDFTLPSELIVFAILGIVCGLSSTLYVNVFYGLRNRLFRKLPFTNMIKPAIGGLAVGLLAIELPQTLEMGYGWVQLALFGQLSIEMMIIIALAKMVTTSFTISSGGSGGVFAPSLVIGGMIGGAVGTTFKMLTPGMVSLPAAFVLVGMAAFFSGAAKVPISAMIMVAEMTRNYNFLIPAMVACGISYIASGGWTIYENQVGTRTDSPAHLGDFSIDLLEGIKIRDIMSTKLVTVTPSMKISEVNRLMAQTLHLSYPVVDKGSLVGVITYRELLNISAERSSLMNVSDVMNGVPATVGPDETAAEALRLLHVTNYEQLLVVDPAQRNRLIGMVTHNDIIHGHEASKLGGERRRVVGVLDKVRVEEVMTRHIVFVDAEDRVEDLLSTVVKHGYEGYPVLRDGQLVGMVSVSQVLRALDRGERSSKATDIMSTRIETVSPEDTAATALKKMMRSKTRQLPVVFEDRPGKVLGIIAERDVLRALELEEPY